MRLCVVAAQFLKDTIVVFEEDVTQLDRILRFQKIDGSECTISKMQVKPNLIVFERLRLYMHLQISDLMKA